MKPQIGDIWHYNFFDGKKNFRVQYDFLVLKENGERFTVMRLQNGDIIDTKMETRKPLSEQWPHTSIEWTIVE